MSRIPILSIPTSFAGGNVSYPDLRAMCEHMVWAPTAVTPTAGGTLTINGQSLGSYDYCILRGAQTVSAFASATYFTATADSRSAFVVIDGDLTINAAQIFAPANRKLFTAIYVKGNLAIAGGISMSALGANHSAGGGNVTAVALKLATGTFSAITDPSVPASGGGGGAAIGVQGAGTTGTAGSSGSTGGGGAGGMRSSGTSGAGAGGSSFSGGPGGGGVVSGGSATAGSASGASGGAALSGATGSQGAGGGAGNSGGVGSGLGGLSGSNGTGGVLVIFCTGTFSGAGTVTAAGATGGATSASGQTADAGGGGSGGGSITIFYGTDSGPTPTAAGGAGGVPSVNSGVSPGGAGGAGTARKLSF